MKQVLYDHVQTVAAQFDPSLRAKYTAAAQDFRMPYFDWAVSADFPASLSSPTISVIGLDGTQQTIDNPLHHYTFHPIDASAGDIPASRVGIKNISRLLLSNELILL